MITHLVIATLWNRIYRLRNMFTNLWTLIFFLPAADEMSVLKIFRQCQSINYASCLMFMKCLNACFICLVHLRPQVPWKWQFRHRLLCRSVYTCSICLRHVQFIWFCCCTIFLLLLFAHLHIQLQDRPLMWRADMTSSQSGMVIFYIPQSLHC